jgi:hypothetical protein
MSAKPRNHARAEDQTSMNVSIPAEVKEQIERICYEQDITKSQLIRKILREKGAEYGINLESHKA